MQLDCVILHLKVCNKSPRGGAAGLCYFAFKCAINRCNLEWFEGNHQFSASAVELEFLRSERRLRYGRHFASSVVYSRFRHSFYALLLLGLFFPPPPSACALTCGCSHLSLDLTYGLAACFFALCCFFEGLQPIFGFDLPPRQPWCNDEAYSEL